MYDFGLTSEQFWALTPGQFDALSERHDFRSRREDFHPALVCSTLANCNRASETSKVFEPKDFMPKYGDEEPEEMSSEDILKHLQAAFPPRPPPDPEEVNDG